MAGIDKIYGTNEQWMELWQYLARHRPQYVKFLYPPFGYVEPRPISNFPVYADRWLYKYCPLKWVKSRIKKQYASVPRVRNE